MRDNDLIRITEGTKGFRDMKMKYIQLSGYLAAFLKHSSEQFFILSCEEKNNSVLVVIIAY